MRIISVLPLSAFATDFSIEINCFFTSAILRSADSVFMAILSMLSHTTDLIFVSSWKSIVESGANLAKLKSSANSRFSYLNLRSLM